MGPTPPASSGNGSSPDEYSGIDPELMEQFIASLEQARKVIGEETARILNALSSAGADRSAALRIREIEGRPEQEIPRLCGRNQMIQESDSPADRAPAPPNDPAFDQPPIAGKDGGLLPFKELAKDPKPTG
ncbi:hypothetical protein [Streptosporangium sp. NPDC002607]